MNEDKQNAKKEAGQPYVKPRLQWMDNNSYSSSLRRPHNASLDQAREPEPVPPSDTATPELKQGSTKIQSVLSVNAPEFFPRYRQLPSVNHMPVAYQKPSVQNRLNIAREMPANVYSGQTVTNYTRDTMSASYNIQDSQMYNYCDVSGNEYGEDYGNRNMEQEVQSSDEELRNCQILNRFEQIVIAVTLNPGEFGELFPKFTKDFRREGNIKYLEVLVATLIDWSITESNFRYNGARFCTYFDTTSDHEERCSFRNTLYHTCKSETEIQEFQWQHSSEDYVRRKCEGLILFLAELIAQMDETFTTSITELFLAFITKILKRPTSDITKCICQALKLVGQKLEKDRSRVTEVENVMRLLSDLVIGKQVDRQVGNMIHSVHQVRNKNWGTCNFDSSGTNTAPLRQVHQAPNEPGTSDNKSSRMNTALLQRAPDKPGTSNYNSPRTNVASSEQGSPDEPLEYGPDGQIILSAEESKFLEDHLKVVEQKTFEELYDENYDDEIATAYEEFLKDTYE